MIYDTADITESLTTISSCQNQTSTCYYSLMPTIIVLIKTDFSKQLILNIILKQL